MREANPVAFHHEDSGSLRFLERPGPGHPRHALTVGCERADTTSAASRAAGESASRRPATRSWSDGGTGSGPPRTSRPPERAADLQREERVAAGGLRNSHKRWPGGCRAEACSEQVVQRSQRERADLDPDDRPPSSPSGGSALVRRAEQEPHPRGQPARSELESPRRSPVEPLHVVDRDHERRAARERREQRDERASDRARIRAATAPQQSRFERLLLWLWQLVAHFVVDGTDQVCHRGVRELRLALGRLSAEYTPAASFRRGDCLQPERRLADPRFALEQQDAALVCLPVDEIVDRGELGVAADDRVRVAGMSPSLPEREGVARDAWVKRSSSSGRRFACARRACRAGPR